MSDQFVGEVRILGCNFAPSGWAACDGQLMPISQNTALFSLLGTFYGGNGTSNFALPDLRDSVAIGTGQGAGLSDRVTGERGGSASVTLTDAQMPAHDHALMATLSATTNSPAQAALAPTANGAVAYHAMSAPAVMAAGAVATVGSSFPHENRQPALALNFCIALQGIYPARA